MEKNEKNKVEEIQLANLGSLGSLASNNSIEIDVKFVFLNNPNEEISH